MRIMMQLFRIEHGMGQVPEVIDGKIVGKIGRVTSLEFVPVYHEGNPEHPNAAYWAANPGGQLRINVAADGADLQAMEVGAEYFIDISKA